MNVRKIESPEEAYTYMLELETELAKKDAEIAELVDALDSIVSDDESNYDETCRLFDVARRILATKER